jgi:hypothetical protein
MLSQFITRFVAFRQVIFLSKTICFVPIEKAMFLLLATNPSPSTDRQILLAVEVSNQ